MSGSQASQASQASQDFKASISKTASDQTAIPFPATYWVLITNLEHGETLISLPQAGTLWVFYEWGNAQAQSIYVWHQGGTISPIDPGPNHINVEAEDLLIYTLANPYSDTIKLGYQYV